jgi:hypothetical protein
LQQDKQIKSLGSLHYGQGLERIKQHISKE